MTFHFVCVLDTHGWIGIRIKEWQYANRGNNNSSRTSVWTSSAHSQLRSCAYSKGFGDKTSH